MIYLSRLFLDPFVRRVQNELSAPYEMHRTLCHAFPGLSDAEWEAARVLFRADEEKGHIALIAQSKIAPDWDAFAAKIGGRYWLEAPAVKAWEPRFAVGQRLRFRLQANPTFSPKNEGKRGQRRGLYREAERLDWLRHRGERNGFELPLSPTTLRKVGDKKIIFRGKELEESELTLDLPLCEVVDLNGGRLESEKARPHSERTQRTLGHPMPLDAPQDVPDGGRESRRVRFGSSAFSAARFDGVLRVTEPEKFALAVENGLGKARAYGFGLLSVARV